MRQMESVIIITMIDHYQITTLIRYMPFPVFVLSLYLTTFIIAVLLRLGHNRIHKKRKKDLERYYQEAMSHSTPLPPYVGKPMDVAYAYLYLASDESGFVTGSEITIDGGASIV